jgi:hypothetical protein
LKSKPVLLGYQLALHLNASPLLERFDEGLTFALTPKDVYLPKPAVQYGLNHAGTIIGPRVLSDLRDYALNPSVRLRLLTRENARHLLKDCGVTPGEKSLVSQRRWAKRV